jgi:hypothetical protein
MTCIIGLVSKGENCIYLAGDSAGVAGLDIRTRKDPKVFIRGFFGFGFTTSFRMGQLLMTEPLKFRLQTKSESNYDYIVTIFIPWCRKVFKSGGFVNIKENVEKGGSFLLVYKSSLFEISDDFQVAEFYSEYTACGCGKSYALASLYTTGLLENISYEERVHIALKAAAEFSAGVREPFVIKKISF